MFGIGQTSDDSFLWEKCRSMHVLSISRFCSQARLHPKDSFFHTNFESIIWKRLDGLAYPDHFGPLT